MLHYTILHYIEKCIGRHAVRILLVVSHCHFYIQYITLHCNTLYYSVHIVKCTHPCTHAIIFHMFSIGDVILCSRINQLTVTAMLTKK